MSLELSIDGGANWSLVPNAASIPSSDSSFLWTIPNTPSLSCVLKITDVKNPSVFALSPQFRIISPSIHPVINVERMWFDSDMNGTETRIIDGTFSTIDSGKIVGYLWEVDGSETDTARRFPLTLLTGTHTLTLTLISDLGYTASASMEIEVLISRVGIDGPIVNAISCTDSFYYVTTSKKEVYRFTFNGVLQNKLNTSGNVSSSVAIGQNNTLFVGANDARAYCLTYDLQSLWDTTFDGMVTTAPTIASDGTTVFFACSDSNVRAVNAHTGDLKWTFSLTSQIAQPPLLMEFPDGSRVLIIATEDTDNHLPFIIALRDDGSTASELWRKETSSKVTSAFAFMEHGANSQLYYTTGDGMLRRMLWNGYSEQNWRVSLGNRPASNSPVIDASGNVYIGTAEGQLLAFSSDFTNNSQPLKSLSLGSSSLGTPAISTSGSMFIGTGSGTLFAIDIEQDTLAITWRYNARAPFIAPSLVTESGIVLNGSSNGEVFCFSDPLNYTENKYYFTAYWPTFLGNNKRCRVATMTVTSLQDGDALPKKFALHQNYPNPFNPKTVIGYSLLKQSQVELKVYDILGMEVAVLVNQMQPAGNYSVDFDGGSLPSGVYLYRIKTNEFSSVKKMMLLK